MGAAAVVQYRLWLGMHASNNDHSVHSPAEALLSKTDEQEKQEGEAEEHSSGERWVEMQLAY